MAVDNRDYFFPFLIYYGNKASFDILNSYKMVILEPEFYLDVSEIEGRSLAYLSVGEIHPTRTYFNYTKENNILFGKHPFYDSYYISLHNNLWQDYIINSVIPDIISKGFKGLLLDTVDSLFINHSDDEVVDFINRVKRTFPELYIMQNRGFCIMDKTDVDAFLLESTLTNLDSSGEFVNIDILEYKRVVNKEYFSVDYWDLTDKSGVASIYERGYKEGYIPFVSSRCLMSLPTHTQESHLDLLC